MRKLIEWIMYSLDIEMAQKLPIAVGSDKTTVLPKQVDREFKDKSDSWLPR